MLNSGVLKDLFGIFVILPPVQKKLKDFANNYVMNNQQKMMEMMAKQMGGGQNPFGGAGGMGGQNPFGDVFKQHTTVDGTAKIIPKDVKKITKSANDE